MSSLTFVNVPSCQEPLQPLTATIHVHAHDASEEQLDQSTCSCRVQCELLRICLCYRQGNIMRGTI